jgi:two-component system response regulator AlgR
VKILIVDDEPHARARLKRMVSELGGDHEVIGEAGDGEQALRECGLRTPDLVLLDIAIPGMNGLETAERLASLSPPPAVILVTAYPEYALDAFERSVHDYLVKPVRPQRLRSALERVRIPTRPQRELLDDSGSEPERRQHLSARYRGGLQTVPIERILYFLAELKYVTVRHDEGSILVDESLKTLEEEFPDLFLRIHRNALVARNRVAGMDKDPDGTTRVRLRGCEERLPVSRRHLGELKRWMKG